jgi:hypothetical protein
MAMLETRMLTMLTPMVFAMAYGILIGHGHARDAGADDADSHGLRYGKQDLI